MQNQYGIFHDNSRTNSSCARIGNKTARLTYSVRISNLIYLISRIGNLKRLLKGTAANYDRGLLLITLL
jgi:hypothetical protein